MHKQKRLSVALIGGIVLGILLTVFLFLSGKTWLGPSSPDVKILPGELNESQNEQTRVFSISLPEEFEASQSLLFKTTHTGVMVAVDGQTIHVHNAEQNPAFLKSPGALWHVVDVPQGSAGKTLTIYITPVYRDYYGNDPVIRYGSHDGCSFALLESSLPIAIINCIILFVGFLCLILHSMGWLRRNEQGRNSFLFVGLLAISIATWSLCQSGFLQFLIPSGPALYLIDFISFYMFPACFNLFAASVCRERNESYFCMFTAAYLLENLVCVVLQLLGILDMFETLRIGHATMALNVVAAFYLLHREIKEQKNDMARKLRLPIYVIILFAAGELITYYVRDFRQTSYFLPLGTIVFILMLATQLVSQYYQNILEEEKMAYFKKLANTDLLTEVYNRNAYEAHIKELEQRKNEIRSVSVIQFDVNDLKMINDRYGHESGDKALTSCCRCILDAFGDLGSCYRIGDDEFVFIAKTVSGISGRIMRFDELVRKENEGLRFPLNVAVSYASFDPDRDRRLQDVIARSEEMMYYNKNFKK